MKDLNGKIAVVTGAAQGIGASIVKKFLEENVAGVVMIDFNKEVLENTSEALDPCRKRTLPIVCNVSNYDQVKAAIEHTVAHFGTVDILINNAGITRDAMFRKMTEEQWNDVLLVDLTSMFYTCKEVVPIMCEKRYGKIINISSTSAQGNVGQANYSAAKAAVQGFTTTLAKELGQKGLYVNAISPGYTDTEMLSKVPEKIKEKWISIHPMKRLGSPDEIASTVCFLASDESSWINGECIYVSGGGRA